MKEKSRQDYDPTRQLITTSLNNNKTEHCLLVFWSPQTRTSLLIISSNWQLDGNLAALANLYGESMFGE